MGERMKLEAEVEELQNLAEELRTDIVEKDTRLDHLQKQNEELRSTLSQAKDEVIKEFKSSKAFTDLLDTNYATSFKDFHMDALELFPKMNFDSILFRIAAESSLLQTSSEDLNVEDNASTLFLAKDDSKTSGDAPNGLSPKNDFHFIYFLFFSFFFFFFFSLEKVYCFGPLYIYLSTFRLNFVKGFWTIVVYPSYL